MNDTTTMNPRWRALALEFGWLLLGLLLIFVPMMQVQVVVGASGDFQSQHIDARLIIETGEPRTTRPNFIYLAGVLALAGSNDLLSFESAGLLFSVGFFALTGVGVYVVLRGAWRPPRTWRERGLLLVITWLLMIVAPITLLAIPPDLALLELYLGYIAPVVYHNPTMIPATFFGLMQFYLAVRALSAKPGPLWLVVIAAGMTVLGLLSKPNYTLSLLPVLGALALWRQFVQKRSVDWRMLVGGYVLAALPVLAWQYLYTFNRADELDSDIILQPLAFFAVFGLDNIHLLPKFILSILFPLVVLLSYPRAALRSTAMWLAWGVFALAAAQVYLLAQTGLRQGHGNFLWGAIAASFILFVASMHTLLHTAPTNPRAWRDPRVWLCGLVFVLHVISGLLWYYVNITAPPYPI